MIRATIILLALKAYRNPKKSIIALKLLIAKRLAFSGEENIKRIYKANGRIYYSPNYPGWPSIAFNKFITNELNNSLPFKKTHSRLTTLIFSITRKCPLRCRHCFEWDRLDTRDTMSLSDLKIILARFQEYGVSHIQLGGGEPLSRFSDLIDLLSSAEKDTEFWILTSGFGLTSEKAALLKKAGLTGVRISIDHWNKKFHNEFRGNDQAFDQAIKAAENCRKAGLVMGLSICVTREFLTKENLLHYLEFSREIKAKFILLLEPRETGHFKDLKVTLSEEDIGKIESFYHLVNSSHKYDRFPQVIYPGYHQRKLGCFGAGIRYLYIDSEATIHACPFCQGKLGNALTDELPEVIVKAKNAGCHMFDTAELSFAR